MPFASRQRGADLPKHKRSLDFARAWAWMSLWAIKSIRRSEVSPLLLWVQPSRVVGEYANYSVFDVADHDELHTLLSELPLFPHMDLKVTPLVRHPSTLQTS